MDAVVAKAKEAQNFAASQVSKSLNGKGTDGAPARNCQNTCELIGLGESSQGRSAFRQQKRAR